MEGEMIVFLIIHGLIQIHFCFVLYTHWKNSVKETGRSVNGTEVGTISDTQMRQIQNQFREIEETQRYAAPSQVAHAVDDENLKNQ